MGRIRRYKIVEGPSGVILDRRVERLLAKGWELFHSPIPLEPAIHVKITGKIIPEPLNGVCWFYGQAMVKRAVK